MNINRNNYEEYFLLYADNELTDSEKAEVLMFVKQNKDLEEEFRMIHHTICKPDINLELTDKSFLLRGNAPLFINEKNYEEVFVLYHDNELTDKQTKDTEDFLSGHAELKNEFELIRLAKLLPDDSVIFHNKKKLYRKEKTGKVVPVLFWRALAAAVIIGLGLWITQLYVQKGNVKPGVAIQSVPAKQTEPSNEKSNTPTSTSGEKPSNNIVQSPTQNSQQSHTEITHEKEKLQKPLLQKNTRINTLVTTSVRTKKPARENIIDQSPEKVPGEQKINTNIAVVNDKNDKDVADVNDKIKNISNEPIARNAAIEPSKELAQNAIQTKENVQPVPYAHNTSYNPDANDNGQNYVFYDITTQEFKKTKVGSFLKKVKRVIARNNPISRLLLGDEKQVVSN